jgi:DNA (cytosine-5)-methyltransferase 1
MKKLRVVSLFSGIGFQEMALKNCKHVAYCEIDEKLSKCFSEIHKVSEQKNFGNIRNLNFSSLSKTVGKVDLLFATFPCQSFSIAGNQLGLDDEKNGDLIFYVLLFIKKTKPKTIIFENVKGITHSKFNIIALLRRSLLEMGYSCSDKVLNAVDFGLPQNRERWFMVAALDEDAFQFPQPLCRKRRNDLSVSEYINTNQKNRKISDDLVTFFNKKYCKRGKYKTQSCCVKLFDGYSEGFFNSGFASHRIYSIYGCAPTFTTINDCHFYEIKGKLTSEERFRLMGGPRHAFRVLIKHLSEREIDKVCGNGIAVPVVKSIVDQIQNMYFVGK